MRRSEAAALVVVGAAITAITAIALTDGTDSAVMVGAFLLVGPLWALPFCIVSDESDFSGGSRTRAQWLELLPWTFLLAPLVIPNVFILGAFFRDSRADNGRSPLTWDRMRPGDDR
jgi:hypothetical protein